jgi:RNA recognition motif-containing protein
VDEIRHQFSKFGEVRDVYMPRDYHSGKPRGFCFVEFVNGDDREAAVDKLDGFELDGRCISVSIAKDGRKDPNEMRRKTRGGGGRYGRSRSRERYRPVDRRGGYSSRRSYRSRSRDRHSSRRDNSRSPPRHRDDRYRSSRGRSRSYSRSRSRSRSYDRGGSSRRSRSRSSRSHRRDESLPRDSKRSPSRSRSASRGRSESPAKREVSPARDE